MSHPGRVASSGAACFLWYNAEMKYVFVGLGNPGAEYEGTRHNVGRDVLDAFLRANKFPEWTFDKKANALVSKETIGKHNIVLVAPETFMNKSGSTVAKFVMNAKAAEHTVVVYDDLDLPLGKLKISFGRGSGGHKGVESIQRALKTKNFVRLRVGVSPKTAKGMPKKPQGEDRVIDFILGKFKKPEQEELEKVFKTTTQALEVIINEGHTKAMNIFN